MGYLLILLFVIFSVVILVITGCKFSNSRGNSNNSFSQDTSKGPLSKNDLARRLEELSNSSAPSDLKPGAMCYDMAGPPERAEYVCPLCGEKTLYTREHTWAVNSEIPACREIIKTIKKVDVTLDESQFCKKCSRDVQKPELCIFIKTKGDDKPRKVCKITNIDLKLMSEFLDGKEIHKSSNEGEEPLKNYLPRFEELFGIKINVTTQQGYMFNT
ncbi:MAG: hypothetical protein HY958_04320 [Bacteroidia bacterium]|nr:hypothetical protein [Bacteroidia bacterium]